MLLLEACVSPQITDLGEGIPVEGIEGEWTASGELDDGGFSWFVTYSFYESEYSLSGYPPIEDKGSYEVLEQEENIYTLTLSPENEEPYQLTIELSEDGTTLDLNGQTYTRVK